MDQEIAKKLSFKGIKIMQLQLTLNDETELWFASNSFNILKQFSNQKKDSKKMKILEYFVKKIEKLFVGKNRDKQISEYVQMMGFHQLSSEIDFYYNLYEQDIDHKTAQLYLKFFYEMETHSPNLYKTKFKLLKNIKQETKKAIEMASVLLKDDRAMDSFSVLI